MLKQTWPFYYLPEDIVLQLEKHGRRKSFAQGEYLLNFSDVRHDAYVILSGEVDRLSGAHSQDHFEERLQVGTFFGFASLLLNTNSRFCFKAHTDVECLLLSLSELEQLLQNNLHFAISIAKSLRDHEGVFAPIDNFCIALQEAAQNRILVLDNFVEIYRKTNPALHPNMNSSEIDFHAWSYALNRLPANITTTHNFLITRHIPSLYRSIRQQKPVVSRYRRRAVWALSEGKSLLILRDKQTDLADFITNLCVHFIEARKLRYYFTDPSFLSKLKAAAEETTSVSERKHLISTLPISTENWNNFAKLWHCDSTDSLVFSRLYNILIHHEDYLLHIEKDYREISINLAEEWGYKVWSTLAQRNLLQDDTKIHIISSNTYSVWNCLSPWIHHNTSKIVAWGEQNHPDICAFQFANPTDKLYSLLPHYIEAHPDAREALQQEKEHAARQQISGDLFMGIDVNIIDCNQLIDTPKDPALQNFAPNTIIINIDYAFGKQGEDLLGALITLFGSHIKSINVMGKAGGLCGSRGDLMLATHVLMERSDDVYHITNQGLSATALAQDSGREVFEGTVLTVYGTLLQNHSLLYYYRRFWNCIGLEMEGSFYAREAHRAQHIGILSKDIVTRFIYYMSDLPLQEGSQLSVDMSPWELNPPVYAITRAFLQSIAEQ